MSHHQLIRQLITEIRQLRNERDDLQSALEEESSSAEHYHRLQIEANKRRLLAESQVEEAQREANSISYRLSEIRDLERQIEWAEKHDVPDWSSSSASNLRRQLKRLQWGVNNA